MSRYKAYPEYKDSEVEWLGDIPAHWDAIRLKRVISKLESGVSVNAADTPAQHGELGVLKTSCVYTRSFRPSENKTVLVDELHRVKCPVRKGEIIISRMNTPDLVGASALVDLETENLFLPDRLWQTAFSEEVELSAEFIAYFMMIEGFRTQISLAAEGASSSMQNIAKEDYLAIHMARPNSSEEQEKIATFLDHETAKIDALIEKQQRLIELLKEKRQAVISHAVTKGLNPKAPMKDSGVEWLGEVPAHWGIRKFNHCTSIKSGQVDPTKPPFNSFILIAPNHIESGTGKLISMETAEDQGADSGKYLCSEGEVIYSKIRPALAKVCISPSNETICSADMYPISTKEGLSNTFLYWSLLSNWFTSFVVLESDRVAMPKINREKLAEIFLPIPPELEQVNISRELTKQTSTIDALLEKAAGGIGLLQERRTALISAAVTGKIDVRDWQALAA